MAYTAPSAVCEYSSSLRLRWSTVIDLPEPCGPTSSRRRRSIDMECPRQKEMIAAISDEVSEGIHGRDKRMDAIVSFIRAQSMAMQRRRLLLGGPQCSGKPI